MKYWSKKRKERGKKGERKAEGWILANALPTSSKYVLC